MRIDRRLLHWGLFLVIAGAIPLAVELGLLDAETAAGWWRIWPLLFVGAGLGLLLRRTRGGFVGGVIVAVVLGVLAGSLLGAAGRLDLGRLACGGETATRPFPTRSGTFGDPVARVALEVDCGELTVRTVPGTSWILAGESSDGEAPVIEASSRELTVRPARSRVALVPFGERDAWRVTLPIGTRTSLSTTVNAGSARLELGGAALDSVVVTVNAGSAELDLAGTTPGIVALTVNAGSGTITFPEASISGSLTVNAGAIRLCVPPSVGLELTTNDNPTGGNNFSSRGLTKVGFAWRSANFASATNRLVLTTSVNVGGLELNPEGGCT